MKKISFVLLLVLAACGADWPQWRGPDRTGVSQEKGLLAEWPKDGPALLWTYKEAGEGYSSPCIVGDRLYLLGGRGETEFVFALDLTTSPPKQLWATPLGPKFGWEGNKWNTGPSAAAVVDGDLVFAMSGNGDLVCVESKTGARKWRKELAKELGGSVNPIGGGPDDLGWGYTCSPLVDGDHVICVPGGSKGTLAALNKKTGNVVWRSKELTDQASYAAPVVAEIGGVKQYIQVTNEGVAGVSTQGALLWSYRRERPFADMVGCTPIVIGDHVYISGAGGSGTGSDLVKVAKTGDKFTATKAAENRRMGNYHGGVVLVGEHLYGSSGASGRSPWVCLDAKTLKEVWSQEDRELGKGAIMAADGRLYLLGEKEGHVKLLEASPKAKMSVKGEFQLPSQSKVRLSGGQFWTHPVIAAGKLYLRDQEFVYCYDVKAR